MIMRRWLLVISACLAAILCSTVVYAQSVALDRLTPAFPTVHERKAAEIASWATVLVALALDTKASWDRPDRVRAFLLQSARLTVVYGGAALVKPFVGRSRPCAALSEGCGIDQSNASMFSAHAASAFSGIGGASLRFSLPLAIGTGGLRIAAGKHWLTDTLAGAGVGLLASRIR